jgi:hypothetical protein
MRIYEDQREREGGGRYIPADGLVLDDEGGGTVAALDVLAIRAAHGAAASLQPFPHHLKNPWRRGAEGVDWTVAKHLG